MMLLPLLATAQEDTPVTLKKNVVKFVVTTNVFYDNAVVLGYERVVRPSQSLNLVAGVISLPALFSREASMRVDRNNSASGFTAAADYRFYLKKENRYAPPRGVYLAPFASYYRFRNDIELRSSSSATATTARLKSEMAFLNIGVQIGYQFVVKDRFTIDFIFFGPSITNYSMDLDLDGDFTVDEENQVVKEILARLPLLDRLIDDHSVTVDGTTSTWAPGYRFTCMIGYNFGRKK